MILRHTYGVKDFLLGASDVCAGLLGFAQILFYFILF